MVCHWVAAVGRVMMVLSMVSLTVPPPVLVMSGFPGPPSWQRASNVKGGSGQRGRGGCHNVTCRVVRTLGKFAVAQKQLNCRCD